MPALASLEPDIPPARLLRSSSHRVPGLMLVTELFFQVPLDYANPSAGTLTLFARCVSKLDKALVPTDDDEPPQQHQNQPQQSQRQPQQPQQPPVRPFLVYLEGGPGFGNREPQDHPLTQKALARGYQVLYLDHRGTGLSTPVSAEMLARLPGGTGPRAVQVQAQYLELMRQDNTVRDCEAVRRALTRGLPPNKARWSIFGQSYGGFVALSYLSMHPGGLREVYLTGGLAPVGRSPDEVYAATFRKTIQRNQAYWEKYPEDVRALAQIAAHIDAAGERGLPLPGGGFLTVPRLLSIGIRLGVHGGVDHIHASIVQLKASLDQHGFLNRSSLDPLIAALPFDNYPIYAILHEAIYCDAGPGSNWSAHRVGQTLDQFRWLRPQADKPSQQPPKHDYPLFFAGEMIFPFFFDVYPELIPLKAVAEKLAAKSDWPRLYDQDQLRKNQVPVYAASFIDDMFVDYAFAKETSWMINGIKTFETNVMYHNAIHSRTEEVISQLFNLRDDTLD